MSPLRSRTSCEAEVLRLLSEGRRPSAIAKQLGIRSGKVAGLAFRARGGASPPKAEQPTPTKRIARRRRPRSVTINGLVFDLRPMSAKDKDQMFGAMATLEGDLWWVKVPEITKTLARKGRHRQLDGAFPEVLAFDEADARLLSCQTWGLY